MEMLLFGLVGGGWLVLAHDEKLRVGLRVEVGVGTLGTYVGM